MVGIAKILVVVFFSVPDPTPSTMTALHLFGAEMLKLSRGLESTTHCDTKVEPTRKSSMRIEPVVPIS